MAGATAGQIGGGGGGGGGGGLSSTASSDFNQNALDTGTPGGQPGSPDFVGNAMASAGAPANVVGGQNDPATQSQLSGLYASAVNPATTPYGQSSGNTNPIAQLGEQIGKFLFGGSAQAAQPSRPGGPAGGDVKGPSWFTPTGPTDPYGNTYTLQPGYQGSPTHPLPPSTPAQATTPRAYAAPEAPATAPAAPTTPTPKADTGGGGTIKPAEPTPTVTNTPPPAQEDVPLPRARPEGAPGPEEVPLPRPRPAEAPQAPAPAPEVVTGDTFDQRFQPMQPPTQAPADTFGQRYGNWVGSEGGTRPGGMAGLLGIPQPAPGQIFTPPEVPAQPSLPSSQATPPPSAPPEDPLAPVPQAGAPVSPQSAPAPGNQSDLPQGAGGFPYPNAQSPLEKLLRGDFPGFMRDLLGQQGTPADRNFAGLSTPQAQIRQNFDALAAQRANPPARTTISPLVAGTAATAMNPTVMATTPMGEAGVIPRQFLREGVPPMSAATAAGYQVQNPPGRVPTATVNATPVQTTTETPPAGTIPGATTPAPELAQQPSGQAQRYRPFTSPSAQAAPAAPVPGTKFTPAQWDNVYKDWLKQNNLPANANTRTRFNIEYGLPKLEGLRNQGRGTPDWRDKQGNPSPYTPGGLNPPRVPGGSAGAAPAPPYTPANPAPPLPEGSPTFTPRGDPGDMRWRSLPDDSRATTGSKLSKSEQKQLQRLLAKQQQAFVVPRRSREFTNPTPKRPPLPFEMPQFPDLVPEQPDYTIPPYQYIPRPRSKPPKSEYS